MLWIVPVACLIECISPPVYYIISSILSITAVSVCVIVYGIPNITLILACLLHTVFCIGVCMSVCLHRYFAHHAFKTSRPWQFVLALLSSFAFQGSPLFWGQIHRKHHQYCDVPGDPHSVKVSGYCYAFVMWMGNPSTYRTEYTRYETLPTRLRTIEMRLIHVMHPAPPLCMCVMLYNLYGYDTMVWAILFPMVLCRFITLQFNVEFHPEATQEDACNSTNRSVCRHSIFTFIIQNTNNHIT